MLRQPIETGKAAKIYAFTVSDLALDKHIESQPTAQYRLRVFPIWRYNKPARIGPCINLYVLALFPGNCRTHRSEENHLAMNEKTNDPIDVKVESIYLPSESAPDKSRFVFAYTVTIENHGEKAARLMTRHWIITDSNGKVQEVEGDGVVGEQPYLKPGEGFQYTSGTMLETPMGVMEGSYQMVTDDGEQITAEIHPFTLSGPQTLH